eukprot:TRINITY_DN8431_c0_g2_i1.p1 TRINITY_DN8431_c0_g2~~TRINITY_DN8431_c0_g2_i1.p1  ORF type:complete len:465 (-),score=95.54 TRINITY_DN8431_c0_g2_i1:6-1400(-)
MFSWDHPLDTLNKTCVQQLNSLLRNCSTVSLDLLITIFQIPLSVDKFNELLSTDSDNGETYKKRLSTNVNPLNFHRILELFQTTNSLDIHMRISYFILESFLAEDARALLENLIEKEDTMSLYRIAYAFNLVFPNKAKDLFPFLLEAQEILKFSFGEETKKIVTKIITFTYVKAIADPICANSYVFMYASEYLDQKLMKMANQVKINLDNGAFWKILFTKGLENRSCQISALFLYICIQLMRSNEPSVKEYLVQNSRLFRNIRVLARSKFRHTRFGAKRLLEILEEDEWKESLQNLDYSDEEFIEDLTGGTSKGCHGSTTLSEIALDLSIFQLKSKSEKQNSLFLSGVVFQSMVKVLQKPVSTYIPVYLNVAIFLAHQCKRLVELNMVVGNEDVKSPASAKKKAGPRAVKYLTVSPLDILAITNIISNLFTSHNDLSVAVRTREFIQILLLFSFIIALRIDKSS